MTDQRRPLPKGWEWTAVSEITQAVTKVNPKEKPVDTSQSPPDPPTGGESIPPSGGLGGAL